MMSDNDSQGDSPCVLRAQESGLLYDYALSAFFCIVMHPGTRESQPFDPKPLGHLRQHQELDTVSSLFAERTRSKALLNRRATV